MTADDRNALPPQDEKAFRQRLRRYPRQQRRLQELGHLIPSLDGIGEELAQAKDLCDDLRMKLALARTEADRLAEAYATRHALCYEERQILLDLELTQNLYRQHSPDYSKGEGLDS